MVFDLAAYGSAWPLATLGGLFVMAMGAAVILGANFPQQRMALVWIGFVGGIGAIVFGVTDLGIDPRPPTRFQALALMVAIALELAAFSFLMRPLHRRGERAVVAGTLAIVGAHFIVMWPAFGPLIGVLGIACCVNAAAAWFTSYSLRAAWFIDGVLKLAFGLAMAWPAFAPYINKGT
jgi:hypothetical protein